MAADARYDAVAESYAAGWTDGLDDPVTVSLLDLLGTTPGQRVLDVACGHGRVSRGLARLGLSVVGVDLSKAMLGKAEEREGQEPLGIRYVHADVADPALLKRDKFDAAVCSFGLSDIDDLDGALANIRRLLRVGGVFAFSILHPCFPGGGGVSGSWPSDGTYYDERWWRADGALSTLRQQVGATHRTVSTYLNTLHRTGFVVDEIAEPPPSATSARDRPHLARFPMFFVVRCTKGARRGSRRGG